jgi:hypothetical protein
VDKTNVIVFYALLFIAVLAIVFIGGKYIKRLPSDTVKKINKISFGIAVVSGILLYLLHHAVLMYIFLASIAAYFLFFNYKEERKEGL